MERICGQVKGQAELAKQALSWIVYARRPLNTTELLHALAVEVGESELDQENFPHLVDIISVCAGLVTVDRESNIIRLVHHTAQEYFERTQDHLFRDAEGHISSICVTYLSYNTFESGPCETYVEFGERLESNPFYDYAAKHWGHHAKRAANLKDGNLITFLNSQTKVQASNQVLMSQVSWYDFCDRWQTTGLHLAAYFGLDELATQLLSTNNFDVKDSNHRTPLSWAAGNGHESMAGLLLERGADIETRDRDHGGTPLFWATLNEHEAVVRLLLERGADIDTRDINGETPLFQAVTFGRYATTSLLREWDTNIKTPNGLLDTPLFQSTWSLCGGMDPTLEKEEAASASSNWKIY